jgi:hypothetical protein
MTSIIRGVPGTPTDRPLCHAEKKPSPEPETARLRLDQAKNGLYRNHGVGGRAAVLEYVFPSGRGQGVGRHHHFALGDDGFGEFLGLHGGADQQTGNRRAQCYSFIHCWFSLVGSHEANRSYPHCAKKVLGRQRNIHKILTVDLDQEFELVNGLRYVFNASCVEANFRYR